MTTLMSIATGNFTAAGTWEICDSTSESDSDAANTALTTSYVESSTFTPGAITIDGIAVKVAARVASPTGTISVHLAIAGVEVAGTPVTINVTDINYVNGIAGTLYDWVFFKFGSSKLLVGATLYSVGAKCSVGSEVNLYSTATTNWSRELRTTTTQAPAVTNKLIVAGECTGAGTGNNFTVTMDNTAATIFGPTGAGNPGLYVSNRGALTWGTSASTNYLLELAGDLRICSGGTYNMGTVGTPVPSTSTAKLELNCASSGDFGFIAKDGALVTTYGNALSFDRTLLAANAAANATSLTTADSIGWLSGNAIAIASTTRTYTECENGTLNGNAVGTALTVNGFAGTGGGVKYAHSGTTPTQAEIINLTRNVVITVVTTTKFGYILFNTTATINMNWTEISYMGLNAVNQYGIVALTTTGSVTINRCSIHDGYSALFTTGTVYNNITFQNNVCYNFTNNIIDIDTTTSGTNLTFDNNILILTTNSSSNGFYLIDMGGTFTNNTVAGINGVGGFYFFEGGASIGLFSGNTIHSSSNYGLYFNALMILSSTLTNSTIWRCNARGIRFNSNVSNITINTITMFGNVLANIEFHNVSVSKLSISNPILNGDTTFATSYGLYSINTIIADSTIENGNLGTASGIKTNHAVSDIYTDTPTYISIVLSNTILASSSQVANQAGLQPGSYIKAEKLGQIAGNHQTWFLYGISSIDTVIHNISSQSERLTPNNASNKLESGHKKVAVLNGQTITPNVWIRKSVVGDGAAYNGNQPRLILKKSVSLGINSDTVLATASLAAGNWERLSGTTAAVNDNGVLEFLVDCDGTAGWINDSDWNVS